MQQSVYAGSYAWGKVEKAKVLSGKFNVIPVHSIIPTINTLLYDCEDIDPPNPQIYGQGRT
jgi:hypothetical protein